MENLHVEQMSLVDILTQGRELSNQLNSQINPLISKETCEHLIHKIFSTYDEAIAYLSLREQLQSDPSPISSSVESPETSNGVRPRCAKGRLTRDVFKKRKTLSRGEQIKVYIGTPPEGPLGDGHSWRKYGQKIILGATHPRAYYRCTHKHTRGCMATKNVQKIEEDPLRVEVTYRGNHTCIPNSPSPVVSLGENVINNLHQQPEPEQMQNIPLECGQRLEDETEETNPKVVELVSYSSPSTSIQSEDEDIWGQFEDDTILARLASPATSESNYFSMLTGQVLSYPYSIRSGLSDMISNPTSGMNSFFGLDMDTVEANVEPNLPYDVFEDFTTRV